MDFTAKEILDEEHKKATILIASISTSHFPKTYEPQALAAMERYAEQQAKTYANWILTQDFDSMTASKLWGKFKKDVMCY